MAHDAAHAYQPDRPAVPPILPDPYDALGADLGAALANLCRHLVADITDAVDAVTAASPPVAMPDTAVAVSLKEAAARLGLGLTTVRRLASEGQLEVLPATEGRLIVPVESLTAFLDQLRASREQPDRGSQPEMLAPTPRGRTSTRRPATRRGNESASAPTR